MTERCKLKHVGVKSNHGSPCNYSPWQHGASLHVLWINNWDYACSVWERQFEQTNMGMQTHATWKVVVSRCELKRAMQHTLRAPSKNVLVHCKMLSCKPSNCKYVLHAINMSGLWPKADEAYGDSEVQRLLAQILNLCKRIPILQRTQEPATNRQRSNSAPSSNYSCCL